MDIGQAILSRLPAKARSFLGYRDARRNWANFLRAHASQRRLRLTQPGAVAPDFVLANTALMKPEDLVRKREHYHFHTSGLLTAHQFLSAAVEHGLDLEHLASVLEFGCGGARVIRHLSGLDGIRLVGTDLLAENVAWCRENVPHVEFHQNQLEPPLEFATDDSFDLILAYSVFTHIPMSAQLLWLRELKRVLKPGGILVVTVLDEILAGQMLTGEQQRIFRRDSHFTLESDDKNASESTRIIDSWDVFMTRNYVEKFYEQVMPVCAYQPGNQSLVVLRCP